MTILQEIREGIRRIEIEWYGEPPDGTIATRHRTFVDEILSFLRSKGIPAEILINLEYPDEYRSVDIPTLEEMKKQRELKGCWVFIPDEEDTKYVGSKKDILYIIDED